MPAVTTPHLPYSEVLGFQDPRLDDLVKFGRQALYLNDCILCADSGEDASIYLSGSKGAMEVALVNLAYGILKSDWKLIGLAMAALEVGLSMPECRLIRLLLENLKGQCGDLNCTLRSLNDEDVEMMIQQLRRCMLPRRSDNEPRPDGFPPPEYDI